MKYLLIALMPILIGCAALQKPPTATEAKFYTIQTNYVPQVSSVVNPDTTTTTVTNLVPTYVFLPNTNATGVAGTAGAIANLVTPGGGGLVGTVIGGLFGLWGVLRSRKSAQTAAVLAQIIETGEQVLLTVPNGAEVASKWKAWMVKHQAETHTIQAATQLVANIVDTESARKAAKEIEALIARARS